MTLEERVRILMETDLAEAREEARAEGRKEGREEGISLGEKQGEKRGIYIGETKAKTETARNLLKEGVSVSVISKSTGLSLKEIEAL